MTTLTRRSALAMAAIAAAASTPLLAQEHDHSHHDDDDMAHCSSATPAASPSASPVANDIPFDLAYIDSMIPHHASVIALAEEAQPLLTDDRLIDIAQAVPDTQPGEIEQLQAFRAEWYPDAPEDTSADYLHEIMMITMAGSMESCAGMDHMDLMDPEWIAQQFDDAEDKDLAFIDLVVPHHQMAVQQSELGLERAEHDELVALCEDVIAAQTEEIETLLSIRAEIAG